ncbi:MAG: tetratricopeptide repeat protein [Deltaproteobacteria bacterium]
MSRRSTAVLFVVALVAVVAAYGNSLGNGFHFDDGHSIEDNVHLTSLANVPRFFTDVTTFSPLAENRAYRPVLLTSFAISHALGDGAPWAYHLVSLLFHVLGAWIVGLLAYRFFERPAAAYFATVVFAVHPLLTEPVNSISARSSLMGSALYFAAFLLYVRARDGDTHERRRLILANVVLLVALGTKLLAITIIAVVIAWELLLGPDRDRLLEVDRKRWMARLVPLATIAFGFAWLHESIVGATARGARSHITPWSHLLTQTRVWQRYQALYVWPEDLCADLVMRWSEVPWEGETARAILWTVLLLAVAWISRRRMPVLAFSVVWFYVTLSPTNSIVPLAEPATEHRVYVAMPALVWATLAVLNRLVGERIEIAHVRRGALIASAAVVAAMILATSQRNRVWKDEHSLWSDVIACAPTNGRAHLNYGRALLGRGDRAGARREYEACAREWPGYGFCYVNLVVIDLLDKRYDLAEQHVQKAEAVAPNNVYTALWRGELDLARERYASAEAAFARAANIAPGFDDAERGLALARFELGKLDEARPILERLRDARRLDARGWFSLGYIHELAGEAEAAQQAYGYAVQLDPKMPRARYNLARLLHATGQIDRAIQHYQVLRLERAATPDALFNLALALAQRGRVDEARGVKQQLARDAPTYTRLQELEF